MAYLYIIKEQQKQIIMKRYFKEKEGHKRIIEINESDITLLYNAYGCSYENNEGEIVEFDEEDYYVDEEGSIFDSRTFQGYCSGQIWGSPTKIYYDGEEITFKDLGEPIQVWLRWNGSNWDAEILYDEYASWLQYEEVTDEYQDFVENAEYYSGPWHHGGRDSILSNKGKYCILSQSQWQGSVDTFSEIFDNMEALLHEDYHSIVKALSEDIEHDHDECIVTGTLVLGDSQIKWTFNERGYYMETA